MAERPGPAGTVGGAGAYKWWALATVCTATVMATMDTSIVTISFPALTRVFDTSISVVIWLALAYQLTVVGIMLTMGRIADILGTKKVYLAGALVFTLGLTLCALAQDVFQLIGFRVLQGIGGAMTTALGSAIIAASFPQSERGKALGLLEAAVGVGLMSGPAVGGLLLDTLGWRAIFYLRIPMGLASIFMALLALKEQPRIRPRESIDPWGSATLFLGLTSLILVINQGQGLGWTSPLVLILGVVSLTTLSLFFTIERRVERPIVDLGLFRNRTFAVTNFLLLLSSMAAVSIPFLLPFYLIEAVGVSASRSGLIIVILPMMLFLLSPLSGALSDRIGVRLLSTLGLGLQSLGLFLLGTLGVGSSMLCIGLFLGIVGLGGGLFSTPNVSALIGAAPRERLSSVSALMPTVRNIGHGVGLAVAGAVFAARRASYLRGTPTGVAPGLVAASGVVAGHQDALLVMGSVMLGALVVSLFRGRDREAGHGGGEASSLGGQAGGRRP